MASKLLQLYQLQIREAKDKEAEPKPIVKKINYSKKDPVDEVFDDRFLKKNIDKFVGDNRKVILSKIIEVIENIGSKPPNSFTKVQKILLSKINTEIRIKSDRSEYAEKLLKDIYKEMAIQLQKIINTRINDNSTYNFIFYQVDLEKTYRPDYELRDFKLIRSYLPRGISIKSDIDETTYPEDDFDPDDYEDDSYRYRLILEVKSLVQRPR